MSCSTPIFDSLSYEQRQIIEKHLALVIEANKRVNLTRIDPEDAMVLHVEDSLTALEELNDAPSGLYGDLGSGAGYPGIPLAVATGRKTTLIDARQKKMHVLDEIIGELGIEDRVGTFAGRAELLARTQSMRFAALTARALAQLPVLMELASPLLRNGGRLVCYKANLEEAELAHARRVQADTGMVFMHERSLTLEGKFSRRIVVFEKTGKPLQKLPRQEGEAQKHPLGNV